MNDIVKNTELFVNILSMSRTSAVQKWDHEAFQRAFRWAYYFEQVHKKARGKPVIAEKISKQLASACSEVDTRLGLSHLQYDDLPRASFILRKNLLENVYLNNDFYLQLAGQLNDPPEQETNYRKQLQAFSKLKATLQILQLIQKRFEAKMEKVESSGDDKGCRKVQQKFDNKTSSDKKGCSNRGKSQIKANAILLRKCLLNVIGSDYLAFERKKQQLHTKLAGMIKHDCGLDVLIIALISNEEDGSANVSRYIIDFIEDILVPKWKEDWKNFLLFPLAGLFGQCGVMYSRFAELYFDVMQHCGDCLQEVVQKRDYVLLMERKENECTEQMYKYYYCLLQNHLHTFSQVSPGNELKMEQFIKRCKSAEGANSTNTYSSVWHMLSRDLMVSSEI